MKGAAARPRARRSAARRTTSRSRSRRSAWRTAVERQPEYLDAARRWTLAAIDYEPWGYTYNKPNVDLAAGHLLYAIGWAYDLLYDEWTPAERERIRASLDPARAPRPRLLRARPGQAAQLHPEPRLHPDRGARRRGARADGRGRGRAALGRARSRAPSSRGHAAEPRRLLLRRVRVLDLLDAVARALPGCVGARDRREPVGAGTLPELEALPRARAPARRPERLRLRRHLGGRAHAREGAARSTRASTRAGRCRATST